jgi:hypothetical protein
MHAWNWQESGEGRKPWGTQQAGFGAALNVFSEFSPEINRKIGARRK